MNVERRFSTCKIDEYVIDVFTLLDNPYSYKDCIYYVYYDKKLILKYEIVDDDALKETHFNDGNLFSYLSREDMKNIYRNIVIDKI